MTLEEEYRKLRTFQDMVESEEFQAFLVKPLREYQEEIKSAYECESLKELYAVKGRKQGSDQFFDVLKKHHEQLSAVAREIAE